MPKRVRKTKKPAKTFSKVYYGESYFSFDVYGTVADLLGISRLEAKNRILQKAYETGRLVLPGKSPIRSVMDQITTAIVHLKPLIDDEYQPSGR